MAFDPLVFTSRPAYMQRIADYVRSDHHRWTSGEVQLDRAHAFVQKFSVLYRIDATRGQRLRLKRCDIASAYLLMYARRAVDGSKLRTISWVLLISDGEHPAAVVEKLRDAHAPGERIRLDGYELVQLPRKDSAKPAWTWRMTAERYQTWRDRLVESARKPALHAEHDITRRLYTVPGFAGIRSQVGFLVALWRTEWKRRRAAGDAFPTLPRQLRYVQRLKSTGVRVSQLTRDAAHAAESVPASAPAPHQQAHQDDSK